MRSWIGILLLLFLVSCKPPVDPPVKGSDLTIKSTVLTPSYTGNGVQWGGYDIVDLWTGSPSLSENDWQTLFKRVGFMRPPIVRIMTADGWNYVSDGVFDPEKSEAVLTRILDFCEAEGITVMFGEWGHRGGDTIDTDWLEMSASFLDWLVHTKGYTCIRYYNMVNEPNGDWSSTNGNYALWLSLIDQFYAKMSEKGLTDQVSIIGPDVAVWNTGLTSWVTNTHYDLGDKVGAYDIHTYPDQDEVRDGSYGDMTAAYLDAAPASKIMLMTELGFKYSASSELGIENEAREDADPYASDDCNMFVYDAFYGIDMADAILQNMRAGYEGVIAWDLDDAMYNIDGGGSTKLKRWGFWNILGAEKFGSAADEEIRPWFYTVSLLCRYFPAGTAILNMDLPDKKGLRAVAGELDGKYTIAIVNSNYVSYDLNLKTEDNMSLSRMERYRYTAGKGSSFTAATTADGFAAPDSTGFNLELGPEAGLSFTLPGQTFILLTNME